MQNMMWGELVRCGGSETSEVGKLGVYFGKSMDVTEEVFCGRMQPTEQELKQRGFTHASGSQALLALNYISATHFMIRREILNSSSKGKYSITDRSRNGTLVNNVSLTNGQKLQLKEGDIVGFKFKNEIKLEFIWTTVESGFQHRRDVPTDEAAGAAAGAGADENGDGEASAGAAADVSYPSKASQPAPDADAAPAAPADPVAVAQSSQKSVTMEVEVEETAPLPLPSALAPAPAASPEKKKSDTAPKSPAKTAAAAAAVTFTATSASKGSSKSDSQSSNDNDNSNGNGGSVSSSLSNISSGRANVNESQQSQPMTPGSELEVYLDQIKDYEGENKELEARNSKLAQDVERLSMEVYQKRKDCEKMAAQLKEVERKSNERHTEFTKLEARHTELCEQSVKDLDSKDKELMEATMRSTNMATEMASLRSKLETRSKQLNDSRLAIASTTEKRKLQDAVRKEVEGELAEKDAKVASLEAQIVQLQTFNATLADGLKSERAAHAATVDESMEHIQSFTAAYDKALVSLHADMVQQNQERMGNGALETTLRTALTSVIPALAQELANSTEDKDRSVLDNAQQLRSECEAELRFKVARLQKGRAALSQGAIGAASSGSSDSGFASAVATIATSTVPVTSAAAGAGAGAGAASSFSFSSSSARSSPTRKSPGASPKSAGKRGRKPGSGVKETGPAADTEEAQLRASQEALEEIQRSESSGVKMHHKRLASLMKKSELARSLSERLSPYNAGAMSSPIRDNEGGAGGWRARGVSTSSDGERERRSTAEAAAAAAEAAHQLSNALSLRIVPPRAAFTNARDKMEVFQVMDVEDTLDEERSIENSKGTGYKSRGRSPGRPAGGGRASTGSIETGASSSSPGVSPGSKRKRTAGSLSPQATSMRLGRSAGRGGRGPGSRGGRGRGRGRWGARGTSMSQPDPIGAEDQLDTSDLYFDDKAMSQPVAGDMSPPVTKRGRGRPPKSSYQ